MAETLSYVHRFEKGTEADARSLLLLHGTGGDENDLLPLGRMVAPGAPLLSVRGKAMENGMPRFFRRFGEGIFDETCGGVRMSSQISSRKRAHTTASHLRYTWWVRAKPRVISDFCRLVCYASVELFPARAALVAEILMLRKLNVHRCVNTVV